MKVCPRCGFVDDEEWRVVRWRPHVEYMRLDLFKEKYPRLTAKLLTHRLAINHAYCYRLTPKLFVERVWIEHYRAYGLKAFHQPYEPVNHYGDPHQKTLKEFM